MASDNYTFDCVIFMSE